MTMFCCPHSLIQEGFAAAEEITKRSSKTFYFASFFLPQGKKQAAFSVYAICHLSDEAVDSNLSDKKLENLNKVKENIHSAYNGAELHNNLLSAFRETINKYHIPKKYFHDLIAGMRMDLEKKRYQNFSELYEYCYKAAGVVGLIMLKIFGCKEPEAEQYAVNLGVAMQLTNILRDVKEDFQRGRIYLPQDELNQYGVSEDDIAKGKVGENFKNLFRFKIKQARQYYANSKAGIKMIKDRRCRFVVLTMKYLYSVILESIEKNEYDVFSRQARIGTAKTIIVVLKILISGQYL